MGDLYAESRHPLQSSFSAVSKPIFASKHALGSIFQNLQDYRYTILDFVVLSNLLHRFHNFCCNYANFRLRNQKNKDFPFLSKFQRNSSEFRRHSRILIRVTARLYKIIIFQSNLRNLLNFRRNSVQNFVSHRFQKSGDWDTVEARVRVGDGAGRAPDAPRHAREGAARAGPPRGPRPPTGTAAGRGASKIGKICKNFGGLVLGCIKIKICKKICV